MESLITREEIRRLEKAAKEKNKVHLANWAMQLEKQMQNQYEKRLKKEIETSMEHWIIAITYALHFSEETKFGKKRMTRFMEDVLATTEGFRTGEYSPEEYKKQLKDDKIMIFEEE
jgi:triosephosphate isomerase